jgi:S1-C subfamily serine protease
MPAGSTSRFGDELATGDIIHMLNGTDVTDVASLRGQLAALADDATMVLQVERMGRLQFVVLDDN